MLTEGVSCKCAGALRQVQCVTQLSPGISVVLVLLTKSITLCLVSTASPSHTPNQQFCLIGRRHYCSALSGPSQVVLCLNVAGKEGVGAVGCDAGIPAGIMAPFPSAHGCPEIRSAQQWCILHTGSIYTSITQCLEKSRATHRNPTVTRPTWRHPRQGRVPLTCISPGG